jgi:glycosyltransferase involved in cell wall biosynthesis
MGKGQPTGVDRVEAAYLAQILAMETPAFGLIRTRLGHLLLNRGGLMRFAALLASPLPLARADLLSRITRRHDPLLARAETAARAIATARGRRLLPLLRAHLPAGFSYLNTGHANLSATSFLAIKTAGGRSAVLIHDTIPLDHPEYTRKGTIPGFARKIAAVAAHADLVIHSANATRTQTEAHFARHGRIPPGITATLGLTALHPATHSPRAHPYFVTIGTIEPRKNHGFLLDLWEKLHEILPATEVPHLLILGRRGWADSALLARLDRHPQRGKTIFELPNLPDEQLATHLAHARALLFPSQTEGFGLPPLEAASLGVAVILPPLPIYRETMGNYPVYASLDDSYSWLETIIRLKDGADRQKKAGQTVQIAQWSDHFNTVLSII